MTDAVVVDASVAVKWLFTEEHSAKADALFRVQTSGSKPRGLVAPLLIRSEITNAIHKRVRRGEIELGPADHLLTRFLTFPVELVSLDAIFSSALALAAQYDLGATYDAQYLALALAIDAEFWTADVKLVRAVPEVWVRWIGDHPATAPA